MLGLQITCLGGCQATLAGAAPAVFPTDKSRALLVYLAVEGGEHSRLALAKLLWPGYRADSARSSLRQSLHRLRGLLRESPGAPPWFLLTRETVMLNPQASVVVDVVTFRQLLEECATHVHPALAACPACLARLRAAVDLYRGDFLAGFTLADSEPFEEWRRITQERLHIEVLDALAQLAGAAERRGDFAGALVDAQRRLDLEPWDEDAHCQVMRLLALCGRREAALAQYRRLCAVLAAELGAEPHAATTALYEQIRGDRLPRARRLQVGDLALRPATGDNLPRFDAPFVGRDAELAALSSLLQAPDVRLVTLVGAGGMGKTRLAVEVGRALAAASPATLPDGVWFVPLAPVHSAGGIVSAIAGALGLTLQGGDPSRVLLQGLQGQRLLLILDNFEQLLPAESGARDLVAAILAAAPGVQMLVTSRARLKFHAEHVYPVPPLAYGAAGMPEAAASPAAGAAPLAVGGPAVSLFVAAAQRVQRDFALTTATLPAVLRICALVQGMPLGLELAAAHAGSLPLDAIADAIAAGAGFLAADWPDVPPRHRSMAAVFGWSWQLLSPEEQRVLRRLAVFDGGFTYAAAEAVAGATRTLLAQLIDKSLLQWQPNAGPEGRYALHELLRQFAAAELEAAGEHQVLAAEHGRYFLAFLAECGRRLGRDEPAEASAAVGRELDNVRGAWQWAAQTGDLGSLDLAAYGWWQYCQFGDQAAEGRESLALAVAGVRRALVQIAAAGADPAWGQRVLAKLLALHANYLFARGCDEEMAAQAQEAIALGAAAGGVEGETFGTFVLGRALQELDRKDAAMAAWENTVELARRYTATHGDCELLYEAHWMAHTWLQGSALHFGDYHGSRAHMVAALDLCRTLGKRWAELYCLGCLAGLDYHLFDFAAAEEGFVAALAQARALGYRRVEMGALDGLAGVLRLRGVYQEARMLLEEAVALARELVFPYDEALSLAALVRLHCQLGDAGAAAEVLEQLTYLLARVKLAKECRLYGRLAAAAVASAAGDPQVARRCAEEAAAINQRGGDILFRLVDTALILGHAALAAGAWAEAAGAFAEALAAFDLLARPALAAEPRAGLAAVALAEGNLPAALAHVERILPTLAQVPRCGYNDPYFVYETCRRVLDAAGDSHAGAVLQRGYDLLQADAATLDDGRRHRFLTAVPDHRALVAAYAQRHVFPE